MLCLYIDTPIHTAYTSAHAHIHTDTQTQTEDRPTDRPTSRQVGRQAGRRQTDSTYIAYVHACMHIQVSYILTIQITSEEYSDNV